MRQNRGIFQYDIGSRCLSDSYFITGIHYSVKKIVPLLYNFAKEELHGRSDPPCAEIP